MSAVSPPVCLGLDADGPEQVHDRIREGFPFAALHKFEVYSQLPEETIARVVGIPARTLARRKSADRLKPDESDRLYRLAEVFARAVDLTGDPVSARRWLTNPVRGVGHKNPIDLVDTAAGTQLVLDVIGRLEHGVFT